jgi:F-type H+-transporting ATPase subunit gamma
MPPLREIRDHMQSIESIAKVVRALEVVSTATSHRLQERVERTQSYATRSWELLSHLAAADDAVLAQHVALKGHGQSGPTGLLLFSSNRGMAGGYDANVIAKALETIESAANGVTLITIGARGHEAMLRRGLEIVADFSLLDERSELEDATPLASLALEGYEQRRFERVALVYTEFHKGALLRARVRQILPVQVAPVSRVRQYIIEPDATQLLEMLLPRIIRFQIHAALLESFAAEHASRAVALRMATNNADEVILHLTQDYNKGRQQAVTEEMLDIHSGAAALERRR